MTLDGPTGEGFGAGVTIFAQPITAAAFAPFGDVIDAPAAPGRRVVTRSPAISERPFVLSTTRTPGRHGPIVVDQLERHPFSSQTFVPLDVARWLVVVSGSPDPADLRAFVVPGTVGVTIDRAIWHHSLTALDRDASFAVMMWKHGTPDDDEWTAITAVAVEVPAGGDGLIRA